jgi:hypothetical protein
MSPERRRLTLALLLSLLIHALLLSLNLGGDELGFPGLAFPWQDRRAEVPELRVVLAPARGAAAGRAATSVAEPPPLAPTLPPVAVAPAHGPSVSIMPPLRRTADAIAPRAEQTAVASPPQDFATGPADAKAPLRGSAPKDAAPAPTPEPVVIVSQRPDEAAALRPPSPSVPSPVITAALSASSPEPSEMARVEAARLEAERQEAAQQAAAQRELAQKEAARQEAARVEAARMEAERQEAAQQAAAQ